MKNSSLFEEKKTTNNFRKFATCLLEKKIDAIFIFKKIALNPQSATICEFV